MNPAASPLPSVDRLLLLPALQEAVQIYGRAETLNACRVVLAAARAAREKSPPPTLEALVEAIKTQIERRAAPRLRRVFNLTGTVLHTNLGRACLPPEAVAALAASASAPCALEFDLATGKRGDRDTVINELLCELTGGQAATVVNNNAAAVFLLLNTLAQRKEVIVSRGELVEIGGSFRIPDIMRRAGAKLVEVGTTNRTHLADYAAAITPHSALLLKVHTSNYAIQGFTHAVTEGDLARLAHAHHLPLVVDLGSGSLLDLKAFGLPSEPTVAQSLAAGADLVCFSGDKLLGGPQAGLLVGQSDLIERLKRNPLKRALRVGKLTLAALEAVLRLYRDPDRLMLRLTSLTQLTRAADDILACAQRLLPTLQSALLGLPLRAEAALMNAQIGSGALPVARLPSAGLLIRPIAKSGGILKRLEALLRDLPRPLLGRIDDGALWLDLRCLSPEEENEFVAQLENLKIAILQLAH